MTAWDTLLYLSSLKEIYISDAPITDAGLRHLHELKNLDTVFLDDAVTAAGAIELQRALPRCLILRFISGETARAEKITPGPIAPAAPLPPSSRRRIATTGRGS